MYNGIKVTWNFAKNAELNFYAFPHIVISKVVTVVNLCFELLNSNVLKETWVHLHCK